MTTAPHACGVDDIAGPSSVLNPVLIVGHFNQAPMGHSCRAPKGVWGKGSISCGCRRCCVEAVEQASPDGPADSQSYRSTIAACQQHTTA
jgi:hypothetical protein